MIESIVFVMMIIVALFIVKSRNLKRVIISLGVLSILASFCYLLYHAPDVAVAEAVIGSALSVILYVVAFKKHHTFYIYFTSESQNKNNDFKIRSEMDDIVSKIMNYCTANELEAQCVFTWEKPQEIANEHVYDLILQNNNGKINIFGVSTELHVQELQKILKKEISDERMEFLSLEQKQED